MEKQSSMGTFEQELIRYSTALIPTEYGVFTVVVYQIKDTDIEHMAFIAGTTPGLDDLLTNLPAPVNPPGVQGAGTGGDGDTGPPVLVRVHSECFTGEVLGSLRCDCKEQLNQALKATQKQGTGVVIYLRQEGRGIGLGNKLRAYCLQDNGADTVDANELLGFPADMRSYNLAAQMLHDLGVTRVKLHTNNPEKIQGLRDGGIQVVERVPSLVTVTPHNYDYLETKNHKMGHMLKLTGQTPPPARGKSNNNKGTACTGSPGGNSRDDQPQSGTGCCNRSRAGSKQSRGGTHYLT